MAATSSDVIKLTHRKSEERGHADHGWLKTYHTFSFANYQNTKFDSFGCLRVINEDRVLPGEGFGEHGHREFEIFSIVLGGEIEHKDSLGNTESIKIGETQLTSTGTGVRHSEFNRNTKYTVHFLQIWALPNRSGLRPSYYSRNFSVEEKTDKLVRIVAPVGADGVQDVREGDGPTPIHSDLTTYISILFPTKHILQAFQADTTKAYVHLAMTSKYRSPQEAAFADGARLKLTPSSGSAPLTLVEGDGAFLEVRKGSKATIEFASEGGKPAEFVFFEIVD